MVDQETAGKLKNTVQKLFAAGKGLLAADESANTVEKRFAPINLENTEDNRRAFRELFFTAPGVSEFISGVILFDETIRQKSSTGKTFVAVLEEQGIVPGIKVDKGIEAMVGSPNEKVTKGLEGLPERLSEYMSLGAQFAKWRAEIDIDDTIPTTACIKENNRRLTEYAKACQEAGIVPIVEPEVMMLGSHSLERCEEVTEEVLSNLFSQLTAAGVMLEGLILKSNMVIAGKEFPTVIPSEQVAEATVRTFLKTVPKNIGGIVFLSGGQNEQQATQNLNEIDKHQGLPWPLTFSYARALQDSATKVWAGKAENIGLAQQVFIERAKLDSLARQGMYSPSMEHEAKVDSGSQASQD